MSRHFFWEKLGYRVIRVHPQGTMNVMAIICVRIFLLTKVIDGTTDTLAACVTKSLSSILEMHHFLKKFAFWQGYRHMRRHNVFHAVPLTTLFLSRTNSGKINCIDVCVLTITESYMVENISQFNPLQFLFTECPTNKRKGRCSKAVPRDYSVHTIGSCGLQDVNWLLRDKDTTLQRTHQQSNHLGEPERSTVRLKDLLSIYQRRCWEGTSTLK